jgi:hypothetical protein
LFVIGAEGDKIAQAAIPGLQDFQRVGEGYFETVVRVASGVETADAALELLGIGAIKFGDVARKQGDISTEIVRQSNAAAEIDRLRARVAELEAQERGGWIRTSGWSNELYSFDRSDNEDGTFALTVSERDGKRLVEIDRLTASDLERIAELLKDKPHQPHYIAAMVRKAVEAERERCAKACEELGGNGPSYIDDDWARMCAAAIRDS